MSLTATTHAQEVTSSPDRLREALSVLPSAVDDDIREELSPYSPAEATTEEPATPQS